MRDHHQKTVDRVVAHFQDDPHFLAILVGGSVAKGWAADNSDVDFVFVIADDEYERRKAAKQLTYYSPDFCDYPDGYVDGKFVNRDFLIEVAQSGSEPARAAFSKAIIAYSEIPDLDDLLQAIVVYPDADRDAKMQSFYSQVVVMKWYIGEAEKRSDVYLLQHTAGEMVFFAGRAVLAYNRVLYPFHKWFMTQLRELNDVPKDFMLHLERLIVAPSSEHGAAVLTCLDDFRDWGVTFDESMMRFLLDSEWNWRGVPKPPLHDW